MYDYYGWAPYVSVGQRLANAKKFVTQKLKGKANPITVDGRKITKTFWGDAWCENLETYSDFENRMPRGRTYIRNGSVVHLEIDKGVIKSYVAGSDTYEIVVKIDPLHPERWKAIKKKCAGEIGSVVELLQGKLSKHVLGIVTDKKEGLFPSPKEIKLDCSCPDWATMCKHVAATLYGVGVLLDRSPELFFKLRGVDHLELIDSSVSIATGKKDSETLDEGSLEDIFGVELADSLEPKTKVKKKSAVKKVAKKAAKKAKAKIAKKPVKKPVKKTTKKAAKKATGKAAKKKEPLPKKAKAKTASRVSRLAKKKAVKKKTAKK
ncbi:MAG: hypothetical protein FWC43_03225 [Planctomycetaceae bacterium]|nr:hypothetical protein [Planctomycetaceae bacterium]